MPEPVPPLFGLVLIGGGSTRMGEDKAFLEYHEQAEWQRVRDCIAPCVEQSYISLRAEQSNAEPFKHEDCIADHWDNIGPMNGIASAMHAHFDVAWLVVPCDMPGLNESTVSNLIEHRSPQSQATVYANADSAIEPLCAIYEPHIAPELFSAIENKQYSLYRCLNACDVHRIPMKSEGVALNNVNTPEESLRFREQHISSMNKEIYQ